jgi:glycosyltransferase involved in cell wall biosynthesis
VSSLPEVVGAAALHVSPTDIDMMANQLVVLTHDDAIRATLRTTGPMQASLFRWEAAAQQVLQQYARLCAT